MKVRRVIKRDLKKEAFDSQKIYHAVFKAAKEIFSKEEAQKVAQVTLDKVLENLRRYPKEEIHIEEIQDKVEDALMQKNFSAVAKSYILYRRYREQLRLIKEKLGVKDELKLSLNAIKVLKERYLLKDEQRRLVETPRQMFLRVAKFISQAERNYSSEKEAYYQERFYKELSSLRFLPNSPTLMNAGTSLGQLSACFVLPVADSLIEIFDTLKAMAVIHQSGGGTGFSFSRLRPRGDFVSSTKGIASGPVSFMEVFDTATKVVMQGGRRRGANMAVLEVEHPDIIEFIEAKLKEERFKNFNLSVGISDEFMQALKKNGKVSLVNPHTKKALRGIKAESLFSLIVFSAYECAEPGLIFLDTINRSHPLRGLGRIEATNPCGEVPLLAYESCNLGSVNLAKFVKEKTLDWQALGETIKIGVRFLDNVVDLNNYPLREIGDITKKNRKIGLGVMGFADMLIKLRIPYNSEEAIDFSRKLMRFIRKVSIKASIELAKERGVFPNWKHSLYTKKNLRLRNATLNSIAPTGSLSIIAGCSPGIEPLFALSYFREILSGQHLLELNPLLEEVLRQEKVYSRLLMRKLIGEPSLQKIKGIPSFLKPLFITALDILPLDHLKIQAAFQEFTDNAVSKTINLKADATPQEIRDIYIKAYQLKLKGITVYRYGSRRQQVLYRFPLREDIFGQGDINLEESAICSGLICPF